MIRVAIVEDEDIAARQLEQCLQQDRKSVV